MEFLKNVILIVLIHIIAPILVQYAEKDVAVHCVCVTHHGREETSEGHR